MVKWYDVQVRYLEFGGRVSEVVALDVGVGLDFAQDYFEAVVSAVLKEVRYAMEEEFVVVVARRGCEARAK